MSKVIDIEAEIPITTVQLDGLVSACKYQYVFHYNPAHHLFPLIDAYDIPFAGSNKTRKALP
jgi:hypothetical protein